MDKDVPLSNQRRVWVKESLRLGVVGVRGIGQAHIRRLQSVPDAEVVAIADLDPDRLAAVKEEFDIQDIYSNADNILHRPDIHAVVLAVPNHLHASMSIAALNAGKHVLVEKPMAVSSEEASQMIAARDKAERVLMIGMNQRFTPEMAAAKTHIEAGAIGKILYARTKWNRRQVGSGVWQRGDWFLNAEQSGGGPLADLGIHKLDLALHLMDFPEVQAVDGATFYGLGATEGQIRGRDYQVEDFSVAMIHLADQRTISLESGFFTFEPEEEYQYLFLHGEKGGLYADPRTGTRLYIPGKDGLASPLEDMSLTPEPPFASSAIEHFCQVLRGDVALSATAEHGRIGLQIIEAIYQSARSGQRVTL